eukprot:gene3061-30000_t
MSDSRAARRQARLAKIAKGARGVRTPSRPTKQFSTTPATGLRPRPGLRQNNAGTAAAPSAKTMRQKSNVTLVDKENANVLAAASTGRSSNANHVAAVVAAPVAAKPAPAPTPTTFAAPSLAPPPPAAPVSALRAPSPAESIGFGDMLSDLLSPEPGEEQAAPPAAAKQQEKVVEAPRAPSPAESIGFGDMLSELLSPEPEEQEKQEEVAPAPAHTTAPTVVVADVEECAAKRATLPLMKSVPESSPAPAPTTATAAAAAAAAAPNPFGSPFLSAPSKPPRRKSQLSGIERNEAAAAKASAPPAPAAAAAATAAAAAPFDHSNPFCKPQQHKSSDSEVFAERASTEEARVEAAIPPQTPTPAPTAKAAEPAPQLLTPVVMRRAAKTPGRVVCIRTPSRPIPEQIELQKTMVEKTDEMLQLIGPTAPLSVVKEARK